MVVVDAVYDSVKATVCGLQFTTEICDDKVLDITLSRRLENAFASIVAQNLVVVDFPTGSRRVPWPISQKPIVKSKRNAKCTTTTANGDVIRSGRPINNGNLIVIFHSIVVKRSRTAAIRHKTPVIVNRSAPGPSALTTKSRRRGVDIRRSM